MSNALTKTGNGEIKKFLQQPKVLEAIVRAKPDHIKAEKLISSALTAVAMNPSLAKNPTALLRVVVQAAQLGLEIGGPLGEAHPVPFGNDISLIIGYRGLCKLARQSGQVASIECRAVYEGDEIEVRYGTETEIEHVPKINGPAGKLIGAYAVMHLKEPGTRPIIEYMTAEQIEHVKKKSRTSNRGPWVDDPSEMWRKTPLRRLMKYAPLSTELAFAEALDTGADTGSRVSIGNEDAVLDLAGEMEEASTADELEREIAGEQEVIEA